MPLPVSKSELNRLGQRLIASDRISEADLAELALVLNAYQQALEQVKIRLRGLGFSATDRVKTTGTLIDKLRRSHGMQLSRMQDLAGARITVEDLAAQDEVVETIRSSWEAEGSTCKVVDRRERPSFGYRAVHVIVHVEGMPVEIQIRTELQDVWAQIVERLGDRWGRGIRYGADPEDPDATVRSGDLVMSRREAVEMLIRLSESCARVEAVRAEMVSAERELARVGGLLESIKPRLEKPTPDLNARLTNRIPPEVMPIRDRFAALLSRSDEPVDQALLAAGSNTTGSQLVRMAELSHEMLARELNEPARRLHESEQQLRDTLQLIANATDEGE